MAHWIVKVRKRSAHNGSKIIFCSWNCCRPKEWGHTVRRCHTRRLQDDYTGYRPRDLRLDAASSDGSKALLRRVLKALSTLITLIAAGTGPSHSRAVHHSPPSRHQILFLSEHQAKLQEA
ncbi:hypothetical protein JCM24511_08112 [Saitozyma sp. JCM 24511]|nr:hypothetical protein JCM24511_08112 [Saitozyma sp. JCM 24511]